MPRTLTALFDTRAAAETTRDRLVQAGVPVSEIDLQDQGTYAGQNSQPQTGGLMSSLKGMFGAHDDHHAYAEGLNRGHTLLSATVEDTQTDRAVQVLEASDAVDLERSEAEWRQAGWTGAQAPAQNTATQNTGVQSTLAQNSGAQDTLAKRASPAAGEDVIQLAEERLVVGKREVERGGVRVRSYIVETPVSEQVTLRQETVGIERRPVNRPIAAGEDAFQDRTIEMRETGEEAVVGKQAVVTEEIGIRKDVGQRTEEVRDTVRHTEVEVEQLQGQTTVGQPSTKRV